MRPSGECHASYMQICACMNAAAGGPREGTSLTARAGVQNLSEGFHDVGLEIPRPLPHGVTVEAILPKRVTLRLRVVKESGMNPEPGT